MTKKRKLPLWVGLVLAMVLVALLVLVTLTSQSNHDVQPLRTVLPTTQAPTLRMSHDKPSAAETIEQVIKAAPAPTLSPPRLIESKSNRGLSLILDDVGYDIHALKRVLALSVPVAISVLPDAPHADQAARLAHHAGQVVMLHLPMQPEDPSLRMNDSFLLETMSNDALRDTFLRDLERVPFVEGVNNHMGSKLTQMESPMRLVMQQCQQQGLFFVDSRTSSHSVAARVAADAGLQWASRQIFLDHIMSIEAMNTAWQSARACVHKGYRCIIIAHPRDASVAFLESHLTQNDAAQMVSIKRLLRGHPKKAKTAPHASMAAAQ